MKLDPVDFDAAVSALGYTNEPLDIDDLIAKVARFSLERQADIPGFAPGARYEEGARVWYRGEIASVVAVRDQGNVRQGAFQVVVLRLPDGGGCRVVAGIPRAPTVVCSPAVSDEAVARAAADMASQIRASLYNDSRIAPLLRTLVEGQPLEYCSVAPHAPGSPCLHIIDRALETLGISEHERMCADIEAMRTRSGRVWRLYSADGSLSAPETWRQFVRPILELLGWSVMDLPVGCFKLLSGLASPSDQPGLQRSMVDGGVGAVVAPVAWNAPLGFGFQGERESSPTFQIMGAMADAGVRWGIISNGLRWRLYHASQDDPDVGSAVAEFVEIDLAEALQDRKGATSRPCLQLDLSRWWALFRSGGGASVDGVPPLWSELMTERSRYAQWVVRRLRQALLESVFPEIAGGFVAYRFHELGVKTESDVDLREVARASLGLVYRLLFLLFAESRELLPMWDPDYHGQSLTTLLSRASENVATARSLSRLTHVTPYYDVVLSLFRNLEHGAPSLSLMSCSGGVFSPLDAAYGFLERYRLSDRVVARALIALGRIDREPVDFRSLTMRHLSAVGEGLLENTLWVVEASAGQAALLNSQGEIRAMSSMPVPDYVGVSALERTLTQALALRGARYAAAMDRAISQRHSDDGDAALLQAAEREAMDALLGIKILDPAMGAGAFLVCALDHLVDGIMGIVASYHRSHPWASWQSDPILATLAATRERLLAEMRQCGVALDPELLDEGALLGWLLAQDALYGIDVDPTAVVLSRSSLSLRAFVPGAPLPSLSRHLIEGNSLKAVRIAELLSSESDSIAFAGTIGSEGNPLTRRAVKELWASTGFDVALLKMSAGEYDADTLLRAAESVRNEHGLLHLELVFPEVFADPAVAGFDVVIGNPPGAGMMSEHFLAMARRVMRKPDGRIAFVMLPDGQKAGVS